jgi:CubicO group peptidase (beta-lactamase class C family)
MTNIDGHVSPGFELVREAFRENFDQLGEVGAAVAVYHHGRLVVDLWGGTRDKEQGSPWEPDTLQLVFSTTKGLTSTVANLLVQRGQLDLDAPVAEYWPEFAASGKASVPVRWLLCHKAGLPVLDRQLTPGDVFAWDPVCDALAAQRPVWDPGTAHGYHSFTFGNLVGEVVRRITGESLGTVFAKEVAGPLGLDTYIGLPAALEPRLSKLVTPPVGGSADAAVLYSLPEGLRPTMLAHSDPKGLLQRSLLTPLDFNSRSLHAAEIPAANGITTARSVAKMYAALIGEVDGIQLFDAETLRTARTVQAEGPDRVLLFETGFGLGFMLSFPLQPLLSEGSFGHNGAGGSLGFADPESGVAFAYVMNKMNPHHVGDPRSVHLIEALRSSLRSA